MKCAYCNTNNDEDSQFCIKCGSPLAKKGKKRNIEEVLFIPKKEPQSHTFRNIILVIGVIVVILSLLGLFANSSSTSTPASGPFNSAEYGFHATFPTYPEIDRSPEETISGYTYNSTQYSADEGSDYSYLIQVSEYGIEPSNYDNKNGLEGMINGMVTPGKTSLESSSFTEFKGYDAVNFSIKSTEENVLVDGIAFIRDDLEKVRAYMIILSSKYGNSTKLNSFINSFELNQ